MLQRGNRVFDIDLPTSLNAIMGRAEPVPRSEQRVRQAHQGELDPNPRVREQPRLRSDPGDSPQDRPALNGARTLARQSQPAVSDP